MSDQAERLQIESKERSRVLAGDDSDFSLFVIPGLIFIK